MTGANPARSRILELGCGTAESLVPMALEFPQSEFIGIDGSAKEIQEGRDLCSRFGTENISLHHAQIETFDPSPYGKFDYVLCHGVFSWCSEPTRARIFELLSETLSPDGLALVSYNTHPGSELRSIARSILAYYDRPGLPPDERSAHLREVIKRLIGSIDYDFERPYNVMLHRELTRIAEERDQYLFHEVLSRDVTPFLVSEFAARAGRHGLQLFGDARFSRMSLNRLMSGSGPSRGFQNVLQLSGDQIRLEQTMDFLFGTAFRETLLCRSEVPLESEVSFESLKAMAYCSHISPEDEARSIDSEPGDFYSPLGQKITVSKPVLKAALEVMQKTYPNYVAFPELLSSAAQIVRRRGFELHEFDENILAGALLEWMQRDIVDFSFYPPVSARGVYAHPCAPRYARWQSETGRPITNRFYETVEIGSLERALLPCLDGAHDLEHLKIVAQKLAAEGQGGLKEDGEIVTDPARIRELLRPLLEATLETIRRAGLLLEGPE